MIVNIVVEASNLNKNSPFGTPHPAPYNGMVYIPVNSVQIFAMISSLRIVEYLVGCVFIFAR